MAQDVLEKAEKASNDTLNKLDDIARDVSSEYKSVHFVYNLFFFKFVYNV